VTRKNTYQNLTKWYKELMEYRKGIPVVVVANKIDVDYRVVKKVFAFASKRNLPFYFVSASDGTNVVQCFNEAIRLAVQCRDNPPEDDDFMNQVLELINEDKDED
jgi:Rab-like protein 2